MKFPNTSSFGIFTIISNPLYFQQTNPIFKLDTIMDWIFFWMFFFLLFTWNHHNHLYIKVKTKTLDQHKCIHWYQQNRFLNPFSYRNFLSTYKEMLFWICSLVDFLGVSQHHKGTALRAATSVECIGKNKWLYKSWIRFAII